MPYYNNDTHGSSRIHTALHVFQPTVASVITSLILSIVLLGDKVLSFLPGNEEVYNYIYGEDGLLWLLQASNNSIVDFYQQVTASSWSYVVFVMLVALVIGACVYLVTQLINRLLYNIASTWHVWSADPRLAAGGIRDIVLRTLIRLGLLILWLGYWYVTVKVIWPFCTVAVSTGIDMLPSLDALIYILGYGVALFVAALHLHVVFLRLIALRMRLIGASH